MSKPKLYLHIGAPKTASTAIQYSLRVNREFLKEKGVFVGKRKTRNIVLDRVLDKFMLNSYRADIKDSYYTAHATFEEDISAFHESGCSCMLYSNEGLFEANACYNYNELHKYIKAECGQFDIKIICYLRRQDFYVESYFGQLIKQWKYPMPFDKWLYKIMPSDLDDADKYRLKHVDKMTPFDYFIINFFPFTKYDTIINQYADIFGKENIIIRPMEKCQLPNGVIYDFYANVLNFSEKDVSVFEIPNTVNRSFSRDVYEFITSSGISERAIFSYVDNLLDCKSKSSVYFSYEERKRFMAFHEEGNASLAREYLGREDGKLFYEEIKEYEPYPGLSLEIALEIREKLFDILLAKNNWGYRSSKFQNSKEYNSPTTLSEVIESARKIYYTTADKPLVSRLIAGLLDTFKDSDRPVVIYGTFGALAEWALEEAVLYLKCVNIYLSDRRLGDIGGYRTFPVIEYKYIKELNPSAIIIAAATSGKEIRTALEKLNLEDTVIYPAYDFSDEAWSAFTAPLTTPDGYVNPYWEERCDD